MAKDFIKITTSGNQRAAKLAQFVARLREAYDLGREINGKILHFIADPDYTGVDGADGMGVPTLNGQATYNLFVAAFARVNHADIAAFIDRLGE